MPLNKSKPFDRVDHMLLIKITQAAIPYYTAAIFGMVLNLSHCQASFSSLLNGVCLGGVFSQTLFMIYVDDLLLELEKQLAFLKHRFVSTVH